MASTRTDEKKELMDDRPIKHVVAPPIHPLEESELFTEAGGRLPNIEVLKAHLLKEGRLSTGAALRLINECRAIFAAEPNVMNLKYPITVCGDVHGQFFDLMRLFEVGGDPATTQYLFLGDYVDRGCFSCECVFYLYALKMVYKNSLFMLRGNHECRQLTSFFNFKDECCYKYDLELYEAVMGSFDQLPLAAIVNKAFFCVHGGLSPDIATVEDVKAIDRHTEIPREGAMCDLLWSDPYENENSSAERDPDSTDTWYHYNETRQCSYTYGIDAVKRFLRDNKLTSIIRAHEAQVDGYKMQMVNQASGIPRVITIFSAPNYCDVYGNKAACLKFDNNVLNIKQYVDSDHPYYLPNFMDVFQWSLPFVAEKVTDMLANVLNWGAQEDEPEPVQDAAPQASVVAKRGGLLRKKVLAVTKIMRMFKTLRQHNEAIVKLKQLTPSHKVPFGLLRAGEAAIQEAISSFAQAKRADKINERLPGGAPRPSPQRMESLRDLLRIHRTRSNAEEKEEEKEERTRSATEIRRPN